jgi:hypothetical protein
MEDQKYDFTMRLDAESVGVTIDRPEIVDNHIGVTITRNSGSTRKIELSMQQFRNAVGSRVAEQMLKAVAERQHPSPYSVRKASYTPSEAIEISRHLTSAELDERTRTDKAFREALDGSTGGTGTLKVTDLGGNKVVAQAGGVRIIDLGGKPKLGSVLDEAARAQREQTARNRTNR